MNSARHKVISIGILTIWPHEAQEAAKAMEAEKKNRPRLERCWRADLFIGLSTDMSAEMYIQIMKKTYWMTEILATPPNKQYPTIWNYM